jgi:S1-C subfamily serine protease
VAAEADHTAAPVDRLISAGFSAARAQEIVEAERQMRVDAASAELTATGSLRPLTGAVRSAVTLRLREQLGDEDYERYLGAMGQPTRVTVGNVETESPAAFAGIQPGDAILSYAGQRVFNLRDLNALVQQAAPGTVVPATVERDGQSLQLFVSAAPLGIDQTAIDR